MNSDTPDPRDPGPLTAGFHSRDHLPHLKKEGGSYFVTFRLAGTLPAEALLRLKQEREEIQAKKQKLKSAVESTTQSSGQK